MINPKVSIITVTYNAEEVLAKTLDSIRKQEYKNIESIIVDGGSSDATLSIVDKYSDIVSKCISEPDNGLYDAMNKGMDMATGDYVWFINAGDTIFKTKILNHFFDSDFVLRDIYYGDTLVVDEKGNHLGGRRLKPKDDITWKSFRWGMLVCHQSILVKKEIAPRYNLKYKIAADYEWVLESFKRARYTRKTNHKVACFLRGGLSQKNILRANYERFKIMKKYYGFFPSLWYNFLMLFRFAYTVTKLGRI